MNWKVALAIITANVVLMSSSYTMLIPFLPIYLTKELNADPETANLWTGAIFAVTFAVCAVMAPIWGKMTDSKGKKLMVMRSSFLIAVTYLMGGLVTTPFQLFLVRVFQGFAAGLWPASLALMSTLIPKNKIGIGMGVMQSANICGGILGPLFGGVLAESFGMRTSFFISSGTLLLITLITLFFIKEPKVDKPVQKAVKNVKQESVYKKLLRNRSIRLLLLCTGLTNMVILLLQPVMTLYIGELMGTTENLLLISGTVFSLSGIAGAIAAPIWGKQGQSKGFFYTEVISLCAAGILIAAQFIPNTLLPFAILQFCVGLGFSGIFPSANAMVVNNTDPEIRGSAFGLMFSGQQIGGTIGPILGSVIATFINISMIFLMSGLLLLFVGLLFYFKAPRALRIRTLRAPKNAPDKDFIEKIKQQAQAELEKETAK